MKKLPFLLLWFVACSDPESRGALYADDDDAASANSDTKPAVIPAANPVPFASPDDNDSVGFIDPDDDDDDDSESAGFIDPTEGEADGCDPIDDTCPPGCGCYFAGGEFNCFLDVSGDEGAPGDPCDSVLACDPGHFCLEAELVPACEWDGCCAAHCDLEADDPCGDGLSCVPWYTKGEAPAGYEHVGICNLER